MNKEAVAKELVAVAELVSGERSAEVLNPAYVGMVKVQEHASRLSDSLRLTIRDNKGQRDLVSELQGMLDLVGKVADRVSHMMWKMER